MTSNEGTGAGSADGGGRTARSHRRLAVVVGFVVLLAVGGTTAAVLASGGSGPRFSPPPKARFGQPLRPLQIHERVLGSSVRPGPGQRLVPYLYGPTAKPVAIEKRAAMTLDVEYARVVPIGAAWAIRLYAPEGEFFNCDAERGKSFVALVHGEGVPLMLCGDSLDGTNFVIYEGFRWRSPTAPAALARSLTTSVTVAHCTQQQIDAYRCA